MKQYIIKPNEEFSSKCLSLWADEYHEDQWGGLIFLNNNEIVAIFDKKDFIIKE